MVPAASAAAAAPVPDLLGGDLLSSAAAPAPAAAGDSGFGDLFAAAPAVTIGAGGGGFDGFDPRGGGVSTAAAPAAMPVPSVVPVAAAGGGGGGGNLFGQEFAGFSVATPAAASAGTVSGVGRGLGGYRVSYT